MTVPELINHPACTGCFACVDACPVKALSFAIDGLGFHRPSFEAEKCINCNRCVTICPAQTPTYENENVNNCYVYQADAETRFFSTSGGAFPILAQKFIENGGAVVGAEWNNDFSVQLTLSTTSDGIERFRRSKYVHSNATGIYNTVKKELRKGTKILFTGLPCQIAGLYAVLGRRPENLFTVDVICAQAPAPAQFRRYLEESFGGVENVKSYNFRTKGFFENGEKHFYDNGWDSTRAEVELKDGGHLVLSPRNDLWQQLYHPKHLIRDACAKCPFGRFPRQGDMTIGDYWGIWNHDTTVDDRKGTSVISCNNAKGRELLTILEERKIKLQQTPVEWAEMNRIHGDVHPSPCRDRLFELMQRMPLKRAAQYALPGKYDIALVTLFRDKNYGGSLTAYALYRTVRDAGYEVLMVERPTAVGDEETFSHTFRNSPYYPNDLLPIYHHKSELFALNNTCERFLVGSDQMFNEFLYLGLDRFVSLDWVRSDKKKAGYGISFGHDTYQLPPDAASELAYYLKKFDTLSTRETSGINILKDLFNVVAEWALDPVFLCDKKHFVDLGKTGIPWVEKEGIGAYLLDPDETPDKLKVAHDISDKHNLPISFLHDRWDKQRGREDVFSEDWLAGFINAKFIVTDSFHGVCFAIIFNKPFIALANSIRGLTRFKGILRAAGLENRLVSTFDEYERMRESLFDIDWDAVSVSLAPALKRSRELLADAIKPLQIVKPFTDLEIIEKRIATLQNELRRKDDELSQKVTTQKETVQRLAEMLSEEHLSMRRHLEAISQKNSELIQELAAKQTQVFELARQSANANAQYAQQVNINAQQTQQLHEQTRKNKELSEQLHILEHDLENLRQLNQNYHKMSKDFFISLYRKIRRTLGTWNY
jgi:coenzyme F420-reducing hydrogenase beta subunit